jgi:hypothetical protein
MLTTPNTPCLVDLSWSVVPFATAGSYFPSIGREMQGDLNTPQRT